MKLHNPDSPFLIGGFWEGDKVADGKQLLMMLQEAEEALKDGNGWLTLDELKATVGE